MRFAKNQLFIFLFIAGIALSSPHELLGYGMSSSTPSSSTSSSSSAPSSTQIQPTQQKVEKLNVDINSLRAQLQQRTQNAAQQYQARKRAPATAAPVNTWEHTVKMPD